MINGYVGLNVVCLRPVLFVVTRGLCAKLVELTLNLSGGNLTILLITFINSVSYIN